MASNSFWARCSYRKALTTFCSPTSSSMQPLSLPLMALCWRNISNECLAIKDATNKESGVMMTTTSPTLKFKVSMYTRVMAMVMTPVNSWEKPCSSPSEIESMSLMMRLMMSPWERLSIRESGTSSILLKAEIRRSRTVL